MASKRPKKAKKVKSSLPAKKHRGGRPEVIITDEILTKVEMYASRGLSQDQIAVALGIGKSTYYAKKAAADGGCGIADACARGLAKGVSVIANAHYTAAVGGNVAAQQFYLRAKGGFHEVSRTELTGKDGGPVEVADADKSAAREKIAGLLTGIASRTEKAGGTS